jgi:hypothetical protein
MDSSDDDGGLLADVADHLGWGSAKYMKVAPAGAALVGQFILRVRNAVDGPYLFKCVRQWAEGEWEAEIKRTRGKAWKRPLID